MDNVVSDDFGFIPDRDINAFAPTNPQNQPPGSQGPQMQLPPKSDFPKGAPEQVSGTQTTTQAQPPAQQEDFGFVPDQPDTVQVNEPNIKELPPEPDTSAMKDYISKNLQTNMPDAAQAQVAAQSGGTIPGQPKPARSFLDALEAGLQMSTTGMIVRGKEADLSVPENADFAMRIARNIGQLAGDFPEMVGGFIAGGGPASPVTATAGAFAVPQAMRKLLMDHYEKGDIKDAGDFAQRLMGASWEAIKGGVTGAATAYTGGAAKAAFGTMAGLGAELATMTTVGKALEGHMPSVQDFIDNAVLIGGLHGVEAIVPKLRNIYSSTGVKPEDVVNEAKSDPILKQDLLNPQSNLPEAAQSTELMHFSQREGTIPSTEEQAKLLEGKQPEIPGQQWELSPSEKTGEGEAQEGPTREDYEKRIIDTIVNRPDEVPTPFREQLSKGVDALKTAVIDNLSPIKNLVDETTDNGKLEPSKNPYMLARLNRDVNGKILTAFADHTFDFDSPNTSTGEGLVKILKDVPDKDFEMLDAYLKSNRFIADPDLRNQSGITLGDAVDLVNKNKEKFQPIADRLYKFQDRMKEYAVDSGILSREKSDLFDRSVINYAPLYKLLDVDPLTEEKAGGSGLFQKMFGSEKKSISSIQGIFENTATILKAAERNRVMQALVDLPELEGSGLAKKSKNTGALADNEITVLKKGEPQRWAFTPEVATAVKAMDYSPAFTSLWAKMFTKPFELAAKGLRMGVTGVPDFALRHGYRAAVASEIQTQYPGVPFMHTLDAIGELFGHSEDFWKFMSSGGGNTGFEKINQYLEGRNWGDDAKTILQQAKDFSWPDTEDPFLKKAWNAIWTPAKAAEELTQLLDNAPRFAEFKKGGGLTGDLNQQIEAAYNARNVSVDYQRYGALTKMVSFAQPFLNVDMQGTFKAFANFKDPKVIAKALAIITLPEVVNYVLNKDDPRYRNAPLWEHGAFMDVPFNWWKTSTEAEAKSVLPGMSRQLLDGTYQVNEGPMIRIPRAFTLGLLFGSIPHMILDRYYNHNPRAFDNLRDQFEKAFAPMGVTTLVQPVLEQKTNTSFFTDGQVVPDYLEKELPQYQYQPYTSELAKQVGKILGHLPQIGPDKAPLSSPLVVDNYIRAWGGTLGGYVVNVLDKGLHLAGVGTERNSPASTWEESPLIKQFFSHFPSTKAQSIEDFKNNFSEITKTKATLDALGQRIQEGDKGAVTDYLKLQPGFDPGLGRQMGEIYNSIRQGGVALSMIQKRNDMTPADKRQLMDNITYQMMSMAEKGNQIFNQAKH